MSFLTDKTVAILYNHPSEHNLIATELSRRNIPVTVLNGREVLLQPEKYEGEFSLIFNDLSTPPGFQHISGSAALLSTYSRHLEVGHFKFAQGRVVNPSSAIDVLTNRAQQLSLFSSLNLKFPKTRVVYGVERLVSILPQLNFPVLVKKNNPLDKTPVFRFDTLTDLLSSVISDAFPVNDEILLVQEYHQPKNHVLAKVDILNGRYLGAKKTFTLKGNDSVPLEFDHEAFNPAPEIIHAAEDIARVARLDVGTIEYFTDRASNETEFYGISPLHLSSNSGYVDTYLQRIGDYFERRLQKIREVELAL